MAKFGRTSSKLAATNSQQIRCYFGTRPARTAGAHQPSTSPSVLLLEAMAHQGAWPMPSTSGAAAHPESSHPRGAVHVANGRNVNCGQLSLVSFNFGMQQTMLDAKTKWTQHARIMATLLSKFFANADIISGCELGGHRQGFPKSSADFSHVIDTGCPGAEFSTCGAYATPQSTMGSTSHY